MANTTTEKQRSVRTIAAEILKTWKKPYFGAVPYIEAMLSMDKPTDNYGMDPGKEIILYFLANAQTWRGDDAKRIKAELKAMVGR